MARLIDPATSLVEEIAHFPGEAAPLYGVLHRSRQQPDIGVLIVPPFLMEFQRNYRRDVLLARALAAVGASTLRFSYRGQGHSGGRARDLSVTTAIADATTAGERLRSEVEAQNLVIVGTRLGGIVAANTASAIGADRVVIADPVASGEAWLRELSRAARVQALRDEVTDPQSLLETIQEHGESEVLGSAVYAAMYHEAAASSLIDSVAPSIREMLLVQFGFPDKINKQLQAATAELMARGVDVQLNAVSEQESWWARHQADYFRSESRRALCREFIPMVVDWVMER